MRSVVVIDSHTGGEPTRVVVAGGPPLGDGPIAERLARFRQEHDTFRSAVVNEPRGSDVMVGALLCEPNGVIFFNNVGYLGMCGHGAIGVVTTLAYLGRIQPGEHVLETPVGPVTATLHADGEVSIANVLSYRTHKSLTIKVDGIGPVTGDIAWGGNWFFLVETHGLDLSLGNVDQLTHVTWRIRQTLNSLGHEVDHVELFGQPTAPGAHSRNFVLCPGKAYDRSPCGTGTSAKLACLAADSKLAPGALWRQESIAGSVFTGSYTVEAGGIRPTITGRAHICAKAELLFDPADPFVDGIRA